MALVMCSMLSLPCLMMSLISLPRLQQIFKIMNKLLIPYGYELIDDQTCNDLQSKIDSCKSPIY